MVNKFYEINKNKIISILKTVYDPEIILNLYEMGLIYQIKGNKKVKIMMTFTTENCPEGVNIIQEIKNKIKTIIYIKYVNMIITFYQSWTNELISNEAKLHIGTL